MARRLRSYLRESSIYAVALANLCLKKPGRLYHPQLGGSMRITVLSASALVLLLVAAFATLLLERRATRLDPMEALRYE